MIHLTATEAAIVAAAQASEATTELLRFAREGADSEASPFGQAEPVLKLADALKNTIDIETPAPWSSTWMSAQEMELYAQLQVALTRFLEGWAG